MGQASSSDHSIEPARLADIYSRTAAFYDEVATESRLVGRLAAVEMLNRRPDELLLELGFGTGWALRQICEASGAAGVAGLDPAVGMLEVARARLETLTSEAPMLLQGDASRLPFQSGSWDCVLCTYTLDVMTAAAIERSILEILRVLKAGGRLVSATLTDGTGEDAAATTQWQERFEQDPEYFGGARPIDLQPRLEQSGFLIVERHYVSSDSGWPSESIIARKPV